MVRPSVLKKQTDEDDHDPEELLCYASKNKWIAFLIVYIGYIATHAIRKSYSACKSVISEEEWFTASGSSSYFEHDQGKMSGILDFTFMATYSIGLFTIGHLGDVMNLRYLLFLFMFASAVMVMLFGFLGIFHIRTFYVYAFVWGMNGVLQSPLWPSSICVVNNWFGKQERGLAFGLFSSASPLGNIVGTFIIASSLKLFDHSSNTNINNDSPWMYSMVLISLLLIFTSFIVFFFLVPHPIEVGLCDPNSPNADGKGFASIRESMEGFHITDEEYLNYFRNRSTEMLMGEDDHEYDLEEPLLFHHNHNHNNNNNNKENRLRSNSSDSILLPIRDQIIINNNNNNNNNSVNNNNTNNNSRQFLSSTDSSHKSNNNNNIHNSELFQIIQAAESEPDFVKHVERKKKYKKSTYRQAKKKPISFWKALCIPGVIQYTISYACMKGVSYGLLFWLPFYLDNHFQLTQSKADYVSMLFDVGQILGTIVIGAISDRVGMRAPFIFFFLLFTALTIYYFKSVSYEIMLLLLPLSGIFLGAPVNLIPGCIASDLGNHKSLKGDSRAVATVTSIVDGGGSIGAAVFQLLIGNLSDCHKSEIDGELICDWDPVLNLMYISCTIAAIAIIRIVITELRGETF